MSYSLIFLDTVSSDVAMQSEHSGAMRLVGLILVMFIMIVVMYLIRQYKKCELRTAFPNPHL